jgi:sarcosine oxidase subunit delta
VAGASRPDEGRFGSAEIRARVVLMLMIDCPYCGMARPEIEFRYGGEAHIARAVDSSTLSDEDLANFLYFRSNTKGVLAERWRHAFGCGRFFNCLRDTLSDKILAVYKAGEPRPDVTAKRAEPRE